MSILLLDNKPRTADEALPTALAAQVLKAVAGIRFGSVELVIHEGRVVQIERKERLRLERSGKPDFED